MSVKFCIKVHLFASGFGSRWSRLTFRIIENRFNWREVVPGNVSLPVIEKRLGGARQIAFVASIAFEASSAFPPF